eukprot:CAMPEP_0115157306 /NCGR_PEP_ID=MMETSP0227-20121206/68976_1 /TAXON_ID=89957 /ORGANISM="Polarella glacialis, Strain CCMP 1383" /LENGTH=918 /DNA_ID=CAMNT_0002568677 /DNA_START=59 /DNA_END=2812 /DNA_ORIENTATION=-
MGPPDERDVSEAPGEDELELYEHLEKRGFECGVHDPDFAEPLEAKLYVDRGLRYTLRLDCEDDSLSFTRQLTLIRCETREGVTGGFGLALMELAPRSFGAAGLGSEQYAGASLPRPGPGAPAGQAEVVPARTWGHDAELHPTLRLRLFAKRKGQKSASSPALGRHTSDGSVSVAHEVSLFSGTSKASEKPRPPVSSLPCLQEAKDHARQMWERAKALPRGSGRGSSFGASLRRNSFGGKPEPVPTPKAGVATPKTGAATPKSSAASAAAKDQLDAGTCANLLCRLLTKEEEALVGPRGVRSGADLFARFCGGANSGGVSFDEFWHVAEQMLLADSLLSDPLLQKRLHEDAAVPGMTLEKWSWFLVQVQDESREVVEAAASSLTAMTAPDVDASGRLTVFGLSRFLCSPANSILKPERCKLYQDMKRPLTEYWIAAAHHIYADSPALSPHPRIGPLVSPEDVARQLSDGSAPQDEASATTVTTATKLWPLLAALNAGCRCISLALTCGRAELLVKLQQSCVLFADVLQLLVPLIAHGSPTSSLAALGDKLWRNVAPELPSPDAARGHVLVVLSPNEAFDPGLEPEAPAALRGAPPAASGAAAAGLAAEDVLEHWQEASKHYAVWPGQTFDRKLPQRLPGQLSVNFLASDEMQALADTKQQSLVEYHRHYLTLAFPLAPRSSPTNFSPVSAWAAGVQMAALTLGCGGVLGDGPVMAHAGRFAQHNGGCGYALKPAHFTGAEDSQGVAETAPPPVRLELRVIAARALPGSGIRAEPSGPVAVAVSVCGTPKDCTRVAYQPVRAQGPLVLWPEAQGTSAGEAPKPLTLNIDAPAAAILVFEVFEISPMAGAQRLAFFAAPVDGLRQGLRWVPLWSPGSSGAEGKPTCHGLLSGLLVHLAMLQGGRRDKAIFGSCRRTQGLSS